MTNKKIPLKQQHSVSMKINAIRAKARGVSVDALLADHSCPTCCRPASNPYTRIVSGARTEGCVDAHHVNAYDPTGWQTRTCAHAIRKAELERISR